MKVRIVNLRNGKPEHLVLDADNVLIETDDGKPIAGAVVVGKDGLAVTTIRDANFQAMLRNLGLNVSLAIDWVKQPPAPANFTPLRLERLHT